MYKLQKYRKQKVSRKRGTSRSLYRKTRGRHRRVKTKQCRIRRCTRISRKYTIKKGNNRVRKNAQRGGVEPESTISRKNVDPSDQSLAREIVAEAKGNEEAKIIISQLKRYINNQYPDDFKRVDSNLNFIIHAPGNVTKVKKPNSINDKIFITAPMAESDRPEKLYIFTLRNTSCNTFYIVRCAKPEGCLVICKTVDEVDIASVCSKINTGESRPLKSMESTVLKLQLFDDNSPYRVIENQGVLILFKTVDDAKYYVIEFFGEFTNQLTTFLSNGGPTRWNANAAEFFNMPDLD